MKVKTEKFHEILSPRCTVLISTIDKEGSLRRLCWEFRGKFPSALKMRGLSIMHPEFPPRNFQP